MNHLIYCLVLRRYFLEKMSAAANNYTGPLEYVKLLMTVIISDFIKIKGCTDKARALPAGKSG